MSRALIVAHGQPSDPDPAAQALAGLAAASRRASAGLAGGGGDPGRSGAAGGRGRGRGPGVIFPLFMAGGWFTRVSICPPGCRLPGRPVGGCWSRLAACPPCMTWPCRSRAEAGPTGAAGGAWVVQIAGAVGDCRPCRGADRRARPGVPVAAAFIDQDAAALHGARAMARGRSACRSLPWRAGMWPRIFRRRWQRRGFRAASCPPVGLDARVPALIAAAIRDAARRFAPGACRWQVRDCWHRAQTVCRYRSKSTSDTVRITRAYSAALMAVKVRCMSSPSASFRKADALAASIAERQSTGIGGASASSA